MAVTNKLSDTALLLLPYTDTGGLPGVKLFCDVCQHGLYTVAQAMLHRMVKKGNLQEMRMSVGNGFVRACEFGQKQIIELILSFIDSAEQVKELCNVAMMMAVQSDKADCVKILLDQVTHVAQDVVVEAIKRKNNEIIDMFKNVSDNHLLRNRGTNQAKEELKIIQKKFLNGKEKELLTEGDKSILKLIVKSEEWPYNDEFENFDSILDDQDNLFIDSAIAKWHVPPVHFGQCKPNKFVYSGGKILINKPAPKNVHPECKQRKVCICFREALLIQKDILKKIGDLGGLYTVFKGATTWPVGSILETSRIGFADEMDSNVSLREDWKSIFTFDRQLHRIRVKLNLIKPVDRKMLAPYIIEGDVFNLKMLFYTFLSGVWKVMQEYQIPSVCTYSRKHLKLNLNYVPCEQEECMDVSQGMPVFKRCQHVPGPSLAHSKVKFDSNLFYKLKIENHNFSDGSCAPF